MSEKGTSGLMLYPLQGWWWCFTYTVIFSLQSSESIHIDCGSATICVGARRKHHRVQSEVRSCRQCTYRVSGVRACTHTHDAYHPRALTLTHTNINTHKSRHAHSRTHTQTLTRTQSTHSHSRTQARTHTYTLTHQRTQQYTHLSHPLSHLTVSFLFLF